MRGKFWALLAPGVLPALLSACGASKVAYVPQPERFRSTDEAVEVIRYGMTNVAPFIKRVAVTDQRISFISDDKPYDYRYADIEKATLNESYGLSRVQTTGTEPYKVFIYFPNTWAIVKFAEKGDAIRFMDAIEYMKSIR